MDTKRTFNVSRSIDVQDDKQDYQNKKQSESVFVKYLRDRFKKNINQPERKTRVTQRGDVFKNFLYETPRSKILEAIRGKRCSQPASVLEPVRKTQYSSIQL